MNKLLANSVKLVALLVLWVVLSFNAFAQTTGDYRSAATGNWSDAANWDRYNGSGWINNPAEGYPGQAASTNAVDIQHNMTLEVSPANALASLTISQPSISLTIGSSVTARTLTVTGNIVISGNNSYIAVGAFAATHTLNVGGIIDLSGSSTYIDLYTAAGQVCNLVFNVNTAHSIGGAGATTCQFNNITINANCNTLTAGIALDLQGTMIINTGSTFDAASYTHTIYSTWTNSGTFTCSTSTIEFDGAAQTITPGGSAFNNVNFKTSGVKTLAGTLTINGNCALSGTANLTDAGYQITGNASGTFDLGAGTFLTLGNAATATSFPTNFVTVNLNATSTVTYNSSLAQTISDVASYGNLTLTTTLAVIKTAANNLTVNGTLTIGANNTLADGGYAINCMGAAITVAGTHTGIGKIQLTGAVATQSISGAGSLNNIEFAKSSGTARITSAFTINGDITVTSATFTLNGYTLTTSGDIDVVSGATFTVNSSAILKVANGKTITNEGTCSFSGAAATPATITRNSSGSFYFVQSAATANLTARYYTFEYCNLTISDGTISVSPNNLGNGTFSNGTGNEYINFDGYASSVSPSFITFNNGPAYNIRKTSGAGVITISGAAGDLSGEDYDEDNADPGTLIIWSSGNTFYSQGTDNFSTLTNWDTNPAGGGTDPVAANLTSGLCTFIVQDGHTVTVNQNIDVYDLTVGEGTSGTLTIGNSTTARTVTVRDSLTIASGGTLDVGAYAATHLVYLYGDLTINGTFDVVGAVSTYIANVYFYNVSNQAIGGTPTSVQFNTITFGASTSVTTNYALDIEGSVVFGASTEFNSGNYTHTVYGNWTGNATGTHTSTGTIKFDGAAQTIAGATAFYNIELAGTGTKTINTGAITVGGDFIISAASLTVTSNQIITITGKYSVTGATATITPSAAINITGNLEVSGTPTIWGGAANTTTVTGNLIVSNNSTLTIGSTTAVKTINVTGNVQVDLGSTLNVGAFAAVHVLTISGSLTVNGTLDFYTASGQVCNLAFSTDVAHAINGNPEAIQLNRLTFNASSNTTTTSYALDIEENVVFGASSEFNSGNYTHTVYGNWTGNATGTHTSTGKILFDGAAQTIAGATSFYNIELAGTGTKTINTGAITVGGDFIISASSLTVTSNQTITISGKYSVTGNSATITPSGAITVTGDFEISGNTTALSPTAALNITGNLEISGTPTTLGGTANTTTITGNLVVSNNSIFTIGGQAAVKTIAVTGDVQVDFGSTITVGEFATTHLLTISGNLIVNGVFDMVGSVATYICNVTFSSANDKSISGTGATCNFNAITINKGTTIATILDVQRVITMTARTLAGGNLTLTNGTFKLSSASTLVPYYGAATICAATARLWLNNASANISCAGAGTSTTPGIPTVTGTLQVTAGTFEYGSGNDKMALTAATAALIIDGASGTVKLYGGLDNNGTGALTISNGNLIIDCQRTDAGGDNYTTAGHLIDIRGVVNFTGGKMTIVDPSANVTSDNNATLLLWTLDASDNFTGSTIQFGDGASTSSGGSVDGFDFRTNNTGTYYLGNIIIDNPSGTDRHVLMYAGNNYIGGNVTITSGEYRFNGISMYLRGNLVNNGTVNTTTASSALIMNGTSQQTISGSGIFTTGTAGRILNFTVDNSSGSTPAIDLQCPLTIQTAYTLTTGSLNTSGSGVLTLGIGAASTLTITRTNGSLLATPTWSLSSVTCNVTYNSPTSGNITTGNELPPTANGNISTLLINNTVGNVLLNNINITVATALTLTAGIFNLQNGTLNYSGGNTITRTSGTLFTGTGATINIATGAALTLPASIFEGGALDFTNLSVDRALGFTLGTGQNITLRGQLTLTNGAFSIASNTLTFHTHDIPIVKTSGTITTAAGSSLVFGTAGNTGGAAFAIPSGTFTAVPSITNFTVNRDNKLTLGNQALTLSGTLTLTKGEFDNNGLAFTTTGTIPFARTAGTLTVGAAGSLIFNANASSFTIPDGLFTSAPATFTTLTLNRGASVLCTLGNQEIYATGTTTLTAVTGGIWEILNADLQVTTLGGTPSATSMFVTNGTGFLKKNFSTGATAASTFPLGDNTSTAEYSPAVITVSANATAGTIGIKVTDAKHPSNSESDNYITRYWSFDAPALTTYTYSTVFTYPTADVVGTDELNFKMQRYNTSVWTADMASNTVPGANSTLTTSSLTETTGTLDNNDFTSYSCSDIYYWSKATGNWNGAAVWEVSSTPVDPGVGGGTATTVAPTYSNNKGITIRNATNVTINAGTYTADQLIIATGGTLTLGANNFTIYDGTGTDITVDGTLTATTGQLLSNSAGITVSINGTLTTTDLDGFNIDANSTISITNTPAITLGANSTINFSGAATQKIDSRTDYANLQVTAAGAKTAQGDITVNNDLTVTTATFADDGYTITVKGNIAITGTHSGAGKIYLNGGSGAHAISGGTSTFGNLQLDDVQGATLTGSGTTTISGNLTITTGTLTTNVITTAFAVTGTTSISGTLIIANATGTKTFGNVTINGVGTWNNSGNEAVTITGDLQNDGTFTSGTGAYTFSGDTKEIKGGNAITFAGAVTVSGAITIYNTNTNPSGVTITGVLNGSVAGSTFNNRGVLYYNNATAPMVTGTLDASYNANTVEYALGGTQAIEGATYHNLILSTSGTKTLNAATTINGDLTVSGIVTFADGTFLITGTGGKTFTLGLGTTYTSTKTTDPCFPTSMTYALDNASTVNLNGTGTFTFTDFPTSFGNLSFGAGGASVKTLPAAIPITINGALTISANNTLADNGNTITVKGNIANSGTHSGAGKMYLNSGSVAHAISGGTSAFGNVELDDATYGATFTGTGTTTISGTLTVTAGTMTVNSYTTGLTVTGATSITGTLTLASNTGVKTFIGAVTINPGTTFTSTTVTTTGNLVFRNGITNNGTFTGGGATFNTNSQALTGNTFNFASIVTVTGIVLTNNTTVIITSAAAASLTGTGSWIQGTGALLQYSGSTITTITMDATTNSNTVEYNYAGAQTVYGTNYKNLTLSGTSAKTLAAGTTSIAGNLTLSGTASAATVVGLTIGSNLVIGDGTTFTPAGFALTVTGTTTVGDGASGTLTISSNTGVKTFIGAVTINAGGTFTSTVATGTTIVVFRNGIINGGTFSGGGATFNTNAQALTGNTFNFANIVTVTGITLTNSTTATLASTAAASLTGVGGAWLQGSGSTLNYAGSTITVIAIDATTNANTVNYIRGGAQTIYGVNYYDLTTSGGSGTKTLAGASTVNNDLNIGTGTTLADGSFVLQVNADVVNDGTHSGAGSITLTGGSTAHAVSGAGTFTNVILNDANGATLSSSTTINGTLTLTTGLLALGNYDLNLGSAAAIGGSPSASNMVVINGTGQLKKTFATGASAFTYPVGEITGTTEYSPVTLTFTANATSAAIGVKVTDAKHPSNLESDNYITRYWSFTASALTTYTYSAAFTYPAADVVGTDEANFLAQRYESSWTPDLTSSTNTTSHILTTGSLSEITGKLDNNDYTSYYGNVDLYYWSKATGNWNGAAVWEVTSSPVDPGVGLGIGTTVAPTYINSKGITLRNSYTVTLSAAATADQLTVASGGTLALATFNLTLYNGTGTDLTVDGTITATTGQLIANDASVTVAINGTLTTTDLDGFNIDANSTISTTNTPAITLGANSTINFGGAATQKVDTRADYGYLQVTAAGAKTAQGAITVNKDLTITTATFADGGYTITVKGNITNTGTHSGTGKVYLSGGSGTHALSGTPAIYGNLELDDANGATLTSTGTTAISGTLVITQGTLTLNAFTTSLTVTGATTIGNGATAGGITINSVTGTRTFTGLVTIGANGTWNNSANATDIFQNGITNSGTFTSGTAIQTFNTNAQALTGTFSIDQVTVTTITLTNNNTLTVNTALAGTGGLTQAASATLNIGFTGAVGITTLTASANANTVNYNYTGAQTVKVTTYYHLALAGSGAKTCAVTAISGNLVMSSSATMTNTGALTVSGNVTLSGTAAMTTGNTLAISGNLVIGDGTTFTPAGVALTVTGTTTVGDGASGTLTISSNTGVKTFIGAVTINAGGTFTSTVATGTTIVVFRNGIINNGTFSGGGATFNTNAQALTGNTFNFANIVTVTGITLTNSTTATLTSTAAASLTGTGTWLQGSGSTLQYKGSTITTITLNATTNPNTVDYNNAGAQTVYGANYNDLNLSSTTAKTMSAGTTSITGNLTLSGTATATTVVGLTIGGNLVIGDGTTFTAAGFALTVTGTTTVGGGATGSLVVSSATGTKIFTGLVTVNSGATWNNSGNSAITFRGGITNNGTFTAGTGIYTFDANPQSLTGTFSIPSVTVTGVSLTNNNSLTVATALAGVAGTLTQAASALLYIGGTATLTTMAASASSNTVEYNGASQTIVAGTYCNLTLSGSGTKTLGGDVTVNCVLTITGAITFSDGGYTLTYPNLIIASGQSYTTYKTSAPFFPAGIVFQPGSTAIFDGVGSYTLTGLSPTTFESVTIGSANSPTITLASALTINGNLTINAGRTLADGGYTITVKGNITNNGTHSGSGKIYLNSGSGSHTLSGTPAVYGNLELDDANGAALSSTGTTAISGTLTVPQGTLTLNAFTTSLAVTGATTIGNGATAGGITVNSVTGTRTFTGLLTIGANGTWNNSANATDIFQGGITNSGTFTAGTGIQTFNTNSQSLTGTFSIPSITVTGGAVALTNNNTLTVTTALAGTGGLTQAAGAALNISFTGAVGITTLTATANGNTVNYDYAGAQTVKVTTYYHLTLGTSGAKTCAVTAISGNLVMSGSATMTNTAVLTVTGNVTLSETSAMTTGTTLTIGGNLGIGDGTTFTAAGFAITVTGTTTVGDGSTGFLVISNAAGAKIFTGLVTINNGGTWNNSGNSAITFRGGISNSGTFTDGTGLQTFNTNNQTLTGTLSIRNITTAITLTNNGTLTVNTALAGAGGLTQGVNAVLNIGFTGAVGVTTLTPDANGNTVNYNFAGAQTIKLPATSYYNLTISTSGTKAFAAATTVNGDITVSGTATLADGTFGITGAGGKTFTLEANTAYTSTKITDPCFPTNMTYSFDNTSTVNINGNGTFAFTSQPTNFGNLVSAGTGTKTLKATAPVTVNGNLTISAGTIADNGNTITVKGNTSIAGTHSGTGKILLSGGSAKHSVSGTGYLNLELDDAQGAILTGNISVNGFLRLTSGTFEDDGFTTANAADVFSIADAATYITTRNSAPWFPPKTYSFTSGSTVKIISNSVFGLPATPSNYGNLEISGGNRKWLSSNLTIGGTLTIGVSTELDADNSNNYSLNVAGNFNNLGTFTCRQGTVTFNGAGTQTVTTNSDDFYNLVVSANNVQLLSALAITNNFTLTNGDLDQNGFGITTSAGKTIVRQNGSITGAGTFTFGVNTDVNYISTLPVTAGKELPTDAANLRNLTLNGSGLDLSLSNSITVNGTLTMTSGTLNLNGKNITLCSTCNISGETSTNRIYGSSGYIEISGVTVDHASLNPGNLGATLDAANVNLGSVTVRRGHEVQVGQGNNSILRYYDITPSTTGLNLTSLKLEYFGSELNSINETSLTSFFSTNTGSTWREVAPSEVTSSYVLLSPVNSFQRTRWTLGDSGSPLPVELLSFYGIYENNKVNLYWATASEINNDYFVVERSTDLKNFETIATVKGHGNYNGTLKYTATDENPSQGVVYYRLKQNDYDGKYKYSDVIEVNTNANTNKLISEQPYFNGNEIEINVENISTPSLNVEIFTINGSLVYRNTYTTLKNDSKIKINSGNFARGAVYFIRISDDRESIVKKFVY
ncbi:MAG: hypothetical protein WC223_07315 [Bacteroidales bacterium]